jgi:large subunit ribosomal protein L24
MQHVENLTVTLLKKGDIVVVISGKDKGKQGKIVRVMPKTPRVKVEGVNQVKRHTKPTQQNPQGGIQVKELPIHISNVMYLDPKTGKPTRLGRKAKTDPKTKKTRWVRIAKKSGTELEN